MIVGSMSEECNLQETIKNSVVINIFGICSETPIWRFEGGGAVDNKLMENAISWTRSNIIDTFVNIFFSNNLKIPLFVNNMILYNV